jgi:hypothetical protein
MPWCHLVPHVEYGVALALVERREPLFVARRECAHTPQQKHSTPVVSAPRRCKHLLLLRCCGVCCRACGAHC